jgi:multiple sugar transport system substrate-binding protein
MKRRDFVLALMNTAALAGCGRILGNENAKTHNILNMWAMGREGEVVSELFTEFFKENPQIQIKVQQIPWSAAHEKLLTAFAGDTLPDIAQIGNSWLPEMAAIGAISPIHSENTKDKHDYFQGIWDTNIIDNQLYGLPWYVDTRLLFYRTDIVEQAGFSKVPDNWFDFKNLLRAIKSNIGVEKYSIILPVNEYEPLVTLALQVEDPILKDNATLGNMQSVGFKKALSFYNSMFKENLAPAKAASEISNIYDEFSRGFFNFYITGPWNIGEFKRRLPPELSDKWATTTMPGPNGIGASSAGGSSLVVMKKSQKKPQAEALIEFLQRPKVQEKFFELTGDLPARKSAWEGAGIKNDKYAGAFYRQLEKVKSAPKAPEWERIAQEMRIVSETMVRGQIDVETAARQMQERADKILAKRRWMLANKGAK